MTIKQFQELYFISESKDNEFDKSIQMVGCVLNKTPDQVEKMNMIKFNFICKQIQKQFETLTSGLNNGKPVKLIRCKGVTYKINYEVSKIDAGQYVEVLTFGSDVVNSLHKIMASIAEPVKWSWVKMKWIPFYRSHQDISNDFESLNFNAAYQAAVFFYALYKPVMKISQPYLVRQMVMKGVNQAEAIQLLNNSISLLDGSTMPKWSQNLNEYVCNRFGI